MITKQIRVFLSMLAGMKFSREIFKESLQRAKRATAENGKFVFVFSI